MRTPSTTRLYIVALTLLCCGRVTADETFKVVDLFEAMDAGQVAVKFIPANAAKANVLINNKTELVLHVELPDAIAAVPVLAQFNRDFGQQGGQNGGGQTQGVGGGFNGGNAQGGNAFGPGAFGNGGGNDFGQGNGGGRRANGLGMGFMRIAPEKTRKLTARTVCLEHGKPDPNPRIAYRMIPIEKFTGDARVAELCRQLGRGEVAQKTAQAAAWHLTNGLSWDRLAGINRLESKYLGNIKFFTPAELKQARDFADSLSDPPTDTRDYVSVR